MPNTVEITENGKTKTLEIKRGKCESCGNHLELVPEVGMCGACTWGEADCIHSENW